MNKPASSLQDAHRLFRAVADPTRLRILSLLRQGDLCVCRLIDVLRLPQSTVSRHLAYLRRSGLVETWEEGTWNYYRLLKPSDSLHRAVLACVGCCLQGAGEAAQDRRALAALQRGSPRNVHLGR